MTTTWWTLLPSPVDELLLIQRGREMGLALGDEQFNSILDNIKKSNNLEDDAQFQAALKQEGMTMADLRRSLERQMLASEAQRRDVVDKISVTEAEAQEGLAVLDKALSVADEHTA